MVKARRLLPAVVSLFLLYTVWCILLQRVWVCGLVEVKHWGSLTWAWVCSPEHCGGSLASSHKLIMIIRHL